MAKETVKKKESGSAEGRKVRVATVKKTRSATLKSCLLGLFMALLVCFSAPSTVKVTALLAALCLLVVLFAQADTVAGRVSWPFLAITLLVVVDGISTFYAVAPKFALNEFLKHFLAYCVFLAILAFPEERPGKMLGHRAAAALAGGTAVVSLISIDLLSTRWLSNAFFALMGLFGKDYETVVGLESGVRMVSIFNNGNIFAGCVGIGVLISLGLAAEAGEKCERRFALGCLAINALAFVLAFSMGATAAIVVAFLAYIVLEQAQKRAGALVLMAETLILTLCATVPVYLTAFDGWDGVQIVPLLCAVLSPAVLCAVDELLGQRVAAWYEGKGKSVFLPLGVLIVLFGAYAALAVTVTGQATVSPEQSLRRAAYPAPGVYTMSCEADGAVNVTISSQNKADTMMHTDTVLFDGVLSEAEFSVPEDSLVIYFDFSSDSPVTLQSVSYQGTENGAIKLGYKLLPGFIANRLQGLRANQNAIQRVVFFEDGLKIFRLSPLIGRGLGSYENGIFYVQSFYYETKYAHNHYIQTLSDTGVIGLLSFLCVLGTAAWAVFRARRREVSPALLGSLGAALVFMMIHAAVEVVFSASFYLPLAYGVLGLINLTCTDSLGPVPKSRSKRAWLVRGVALLLAIYTGFLMGNLRAKSLSNQSSFPALSEAVKIDKFEWADYALSYVVAAYDGNAEGHPEIMAQAQEYMPRLERVQSNTIPWYLAKCYFNAGQVDDAFRLLQQYTSYVSANPSLWQNAFSLALNYYDSSDGFNKGIRDLYASMQSWNEKNMGTLTLGDQIEAAVQSVLAQQ